MLSLECYPQGSDQKLVTFGADTDDADWGEAFSRKLNIPMELISIRNEGLSRGGQASRTAHNNAHGNKTNLIFISLIGRPISAPVVKHLA
jgi:hypothetical protein